MINSYQLFFDDLPNQVILIYYTYLYFKKISNFSKNNSNKKTLSANQIWFLLGNQILSFKNEIKLSGGNHSVLENLLKKLIKISFIDLINNSTLYIKNSLQFQILIDFVYDLHLLKKKYSKLNLNKFKLIDNTIKQIKKISFIIPFNIHQHLNLPSEKKISNLINYLKIALNTDFSLIWLFVSQRLAILNDALVNFQQLKKISFNELFYFVINILPEARRLNHFFKNYDLTDDKRSYQALSEVMNIEIISNYNFTKHDSISIKNNKSLFFNSSNFNLTDLAFNVKNLLQEFRG